MKTKESKPGRKKFIKQILAGTGLVALSGLGIKLWKNYQRENKRIITGKLMGPSFSKGHLLRDNKFPEPLIFEETDVVISGGGIAGLSAARWLQKNGVYNYKLFELENKTGGNSISDSNKISAYPWGAHYLPVPVLTDALLLSFLEEIGVVSGKDERGIPVYDERQICFEPQERLFLHGKWQDGLIPHLGVNENELRQITKFLEFTDSLKGKKGMDGKSIFSIPLNDSSEDEEWRNLDKISMASWMNTNEYDSRHLHWYVNYCCRDDYGSTMENTSAWAALHYFASRDGSGINAPKGSVLTWPEGNGFLANQLAVLSKNNTICGHLIYSIENKEGMVLVNALNAETGEARQIKCKAAIFCGPQFVASKIVKGLAENRSTNFEYAPWMVANVTLDKKPGGDGIPLSWDNVSFHSESLGYIYSGHQNLKGYSLQETVITCYQPLDKYTPKDERKSAFSKTLEEWQSDVLRELEKMHPGIGDEVSNIDCWVWGHAMIRPTPGFIWGEERRKAQQPHENIFFAHSDLSGISIFEEAFHQGIEAANGVLKKLKTL